MDHIVDHEVLDLADADAWAAWLEANHERRGDAWLRIAKRRSGLATIGITDAIDVALCFGWIDGHRRGLDEVSFLQRYSRRRARSSWSAVNVAKAQALVAAGRMRPAGFAEIAAARADGRWDAAYPSQAVAEVPADLAAALAADPPAAAAFDRLGRTEWYLLILPLLKATTPAARSAALARTVAALGAACGRGSASADVADPAGLLHASSRRPGRGSPPLTDAKCVEWRV